MSGRGRGTAVGWWDEPDAPGAGESSVFAGVVFNRPLDSVFTYGVPESLAATLRPGHRVRVPLGRGNKPVTGYCVSVGAESDVDPRKVKDVLEILDDPPLIDPVMLDLTRWLARYYLCSWGQALDAVVPAGVKKQAGTRLRNILTVTDQTRRLRHTLKLTPKQTEALAVLCESLSPMPLAEVCERARCGPNAITGLKKLGLIETLQERIANPASAVAPADRPDPKARPTLTPEQAGAMQALAPALAADADAFRVFLLHGVTGSGKTEVYLNSIEQVVANGREAIVLVPEISLTPQTIRRFKRRFSRVAVLHSHLSDAERHRHWQSIASGEIEVVVGARSAIFAPARKLGLIIIDEEHETSFKQETTPRYHARDVAVKRAQMLKIPVILGSATPSLETWRNAELDRYTRIALNQRVEERPMPQVTLIDLRNEKPEPGRHPGGLSMPMRFAMGESLESDGQVILFLNRRGYHTYIFCPKCGHVLKCDSCDVALTHHKGRQRVICHTCDAERNPPPDCPACGQSKLIYGGIGTERLEREVKADFGDRVVRRMDSDTMRSAGSHEQVLAAFKDRKIDILLGTQMIAKGLDFPNVTLVGVVNADTALHLPDFRARERTFQLVAQVAGRTGRGEREGRVYVQTYAPDDHAIQCASKHDYLSFIAGELPVRAEQGYPPYGRLVRIIVRGPDEKGAEKFLQDFAEQLRGVAAPGVLILGPAPAPIVKIRDLFRFHLQLRAPQAKPLQDLLHAVLPELDVPSQVEMAIDVDPVSML